jgi:predicted nucleic acid-binding protein
MIIVFCDTNVIFWLLHRICTWEKLSHSELFQLAQNHSVYISSFVLWEAAKNLDEKYNIVLNESHVALFYQQSNIKILWSIKRLNSNLVSYVNDLDDIQILQDALDIGATMLLTQNIRDFNIREIYDDFNIKVSNRIPEELLLQSREG